MDIMPITTGGNMKGDTIRVRTRPRMNCTRCSSIPRATPRTNCTIRALTYRMALKRAPFQNCSSASNAL